MQMADLGKVDPAFWTRSLRDLERTFKSMKDYGGFQTVCKDWSASEKAECLVELDDLVGVLTHWQRELRHDLGRSKCGRALLREGRAASSSIVPRPMRH
jgi:hypothetical protein